MILTCPECKSRYVVNPNALLPVGRTVRCAKCSHSWFEEKPQENIEVIPPEKDEKESAAPDDASDDVVDKYKSSEQEKAEREAAIKEGAGGANDGGEDFDFPISNPRKRRRPVPKGSNLPALQNHKYGSNKIGWISLAVFVTAIISSFLIFQETISTSWPASKKLYHVIGLDGTKVVEVAREPDLGPIEDRLKIDGITPRLDTINNVSHLVIAAYVENISDEVQTIPDMKVILLDENRNVVRDWSYSPEINVVNANERVNFETSLPSPPPEAKDISVIFLTN